MTYEHPTEAQLAAREVQRKRRSEGTLEDYLAGKTRTQPLFQPHDHATPYDAEDPRHGTLSAYTQGCRCPWCREAGKASRSYKKAGVRLPKGFNSRHAESQGS